MTDDELLHEVLVAPRRAFVPLPDTRVIERPGWVQLMTPSLRTGGMNEVCLAVLDPDEADAIIDRTLAEYRDQGIHFRWTVGPDSAPVDLVDRLQRRGLRPIPVIGAARALDHLALERPPEVTVEAVDEGNVEAYTQVMAQGWDADPRSLLALHRRVLETARERAPMVLVRHRGEPAGSAAMVLLPRSAFLMGAVVLPEHRGRGLYRTLVAARAEQAMRRGITVATTHAIERTSAPILARLGFREVCRLTMLSDP